MWRFWPGIGWRTATVERFCLRVLVCACAIACSSATLLARAAPPSAPETVKVSPPDVSFQVLQETDSAQRGGELNLVFSITNKSDLPIYDLTLKAYPTDSELKFTLPALAAIPAYGSQEAAAKCKVDATAEFQTYHAILVLQYSWKAGATSYSSTQNATLSVQVNRRFEDEAKGLPGGTAALLYLILPIMTIFLAYQIVDSLRQGKLVIAEFKPAHIAVAFLFAILFNFLLLFEWQKDQSYLYATPRGFAKSLLLLGALGALPPALRWLGQIYRWNQYAFRADDTKATYLRKALHQLETGEVTWATVTVDGVEWAGARLRQPMVCHPEGKEVLGACLQISAKPTGTPTSAELKQVISEEGVITDRKKLLQYLKLDAVNLGFTKNITQAGTEIPALFVETGNTAPGVEAGTPEKIVRFSG